MTAHIFARRLEGGRIDTHTIRSNLPPSFFVFFAVFAFSPSPNQLPPSRSSRPASHMGTCTRPSPLPRSISPLRRAERLKSCTCQLTASRCSQQIPSITLTQRLASRADHSSSSVRGCLVCEVVTALHEKFAQFAGRVRIYLFVCHSTHVVGRLCCSGRCCDTVRLLWGRFSMVVLCSSPSSSFRGFYFVCCVCVEESVLNRAGVGSIRDYIVETHCKTIRSVYVSVLLAGERCICV
jgi:hypothetical protein